MRKLILAILAGTTFLTACDKKTYDANDNDALVHFTVVDEKGKPQAGASILIFDETGYEQFKKDRKTEPMAYTLTLPDGKVSYRLPYQVWFTKSSRVVTFVVMEEADADNYHIWAVSRTIKAADRLEVAFKLDRTPESTDPAKPGDPEGSSDKEKPGSAR